MSPDQMALGKNCSPRCLQQAVLFAATGSLFSGFGLAVITTTLGQPTFYESLSLVADPIDPDYGYTNTIIGAVNGVFFGGGFFGTLLSGWTADRFGRVNGFRIASALGIIGAAIQAGSVNVAMYLVARLITGLAAGKTLAAMPTYYAEVSPPHSRGLMTGAHGSFINLGYFLAGWIGFGCFHAPDTTFSWRFPNAVLVLLGIILMIGTFFSKSRSYDDHFFNLERHGRSAEAYELLRKLHHSASDPEDHFAQREFAQIERQQAADAAVLARDGKWQLFTTKTYRKRFILAFLVMAGGQNVGTLVINNYTVLLYQSLGLNNQISIMLSALYNTLAAIANFVGAYYSDRLGRRKALIWGYSINMSMFIVATGLIAKYSTSASKGLAAAAVVFLYLYVIAYGGLIDINQFTAVTEIFPSYLRSEATSYSVSAIFLMDVLWLQLAPTAQASIGWKYYLVFVCLGLAHTVHIYFFLPDANGMALEEIDALFGKKPATTLTDNSLEAEVQDSLPSKEDATAVHVTKV
ncbi:Sugar transporter family protein [Cladophialophora carrionii]|uniref:Sugar transporter family protein n=1 Tax=Cladophialophora carrionii TaxID=86049 RepID=A0A1C1CLK2_9EURO|nr:Sugar transporter family protein [Cladophialophora carrionii]